MAADLISVVTGGGIGVLGGLLSNYAIEQYKSKKAVKHLAQSFLGEIKALRGKLGTFPVFSIANP